MSAIAVRRVEPLSRPPEASITVPGSKSHTNRALVCAALAPGRSVLEGVGLGDDTEAMIGALESLGFGVETDRRQLRVEIEGGVDRLATGTVDVRVNQSGTTGRFLLPVCALGPGRYRIDGADQLRRRPFGPLAEALRSLGAEVVGDRLPIEVVRPVPAGGEVSLPGSVSSQFLTALALSGPAMRGGLRVRLTDELVSRPYLDLTVATMSGFGVAVEVHGDLVTVPQQTYVPAQVAVEPDASTASYFFAAAAISGGSVTVRGLGTATLQGDLGFVRILEAMGAEVTMTADATTVRSGNVLRGVDVDMSDISDTVPTAAVVAATATSPTRIRGVGFIRAKESDRIAALVTELGRLGVSATEHEDGLTVVPGPIGPGTVHTYDDHRVAMSFALLGLVAPGIEIADPDCVAKTCPDFWERLDALRR